MCGIAGGWCDEPISESAIKTSLDSMIHRGPDDFGVFQDGDLFLAMRRLSIIDLSGGHQPIFNEDRTISVVCNGEIYNYKELMTQLKQQGHQFRTHSDTEVLVHLYEEYGDDLCQHLRGMYGFAIWDSRSRMLLLGRDRFGKKPLYYTRTKSGGFLFATELKALKPLAISAGNRWTIRDQGIYDYLSLGVVPQPDTVFENVYSVPAATLMSFDGRHVKTNRYWQLKYRPKQRIAYDDVMEQTRSLLNEAVKLRLRSDVPLGVFLSGGVDSTVVTYEAAREVGHNLHTFTVAVDDQSLDESTIASRTAHALGVQHTVLPMQVAPLDSLQALVKQYDQPNADFGAIPAMAIAELARDYVTVVLNGDGGDEIFAGYRRHLAAHWAGRLEFLPAFLTGTLGQLLSSLATKRRSAFGFAARVARGLSLNKGARYLAWTVDKLNEQDKQAIWLKGLVKPTEQWIESIMPAGLNGLDEQTCSDIQINLQSDLLVKMDIATMASSLEARSPLLDHKLAEFLASMPSQYRLRNGQLKGLLKDSYRGQIPQEVIAGKKRGFEIPIQHWLETDLKNLVDDLLLDKNAQVRTYLDDRFVNGLVGKNIMRDRNWATILYSILILEMWLRDFRCDMEIKRPTGVFQLKTPALVG